MEDLQVLTDTLNILGVAFHTCTLRVRVVLNGKKNIKIKPTLSNLYEIFVYRTVISVVNSVSEAKRRGYMKRWPSSNNYETKTEISVANQSTTMEAVAFLHHLAWNAHRALDEDRDRVVLQEPRVDL